MARTGRPGRRHPRSLVAGLGRYSRRMAEPPSDWSVPDDWRAQTAGPEYYGAELRWSEWRRPRPVWDHDHCAFCWATFSEHTEDALRHGYRTGRSDWVCPACADEFAAAFSLRLCGGRPPGDDGRGPPTGPPPEL